MTNKEYRFKFYLNARHSMDLNNKINNIHPHTWEFNLYLKKECEEFVQFSTVEHELNFFLSIYEGQFLNEIPPFNLIEPSLENIGSTLYEQIKRIMGANCWSLLRLEISENPSRTYIIYEDRGPYSGAGGDGSYKDTYTSSKDNVSFQPDNEDPTKELGPYKNEAILKKVVNGDNIINFPKRDDKKDESKKTAAAVDLEKYNDENSEEESTEVPLERLESSFEAISAAVKDIVNVVSLLKDNDKAKECLGKIADASEVMVSVLADVSGLKASISEKSDDIEADEREIEPEETAAEMELEIEPEEIAAAIEQEQEDNSIKDAEPSENAEAQPEIAAAAELLESNSSGKIRKRNSSMLRNILVVFLAATMLMTYVLSRGPFPWGSDTWGHIFKAHFLYTEFIKGNIYPTYTDLWYNGIQPFRYWAPLPYYILLVFEIITKGDSILSYNMFLAFTFISGAFAWILWGEKTGRRNLALALALLWFFIPDNARVLFSEGNIPRVVVANIFPYLLLFAWSYIENHSKRSFIMTAVCMFLITLSHAMIAAMSAIAATLFLIIYGALEKKKRYAFEAIFALVIGILLSGFWLYPALKGGIMTLDQDAVSSVMEMLTYPLLDSLNPFIRLKNSEVYYFGLSVFAIAVFGIVFGNKKSKAGFIVTIIILLGTTKALLFLFQKIPMSQLFWMMRFTPLAYGVFCIGLLLWKRLRKEFILIAIMLLTADSWISVKVLCTDVPPPRNLTNAVSYAVDAASQRIAILDNSEFGSFPSYYLANSEKGKAIPQMYGWAWQGAKTADNIMWINTALEKEWYTFLFDRCLEMGADTLVVKKDKVLDKKDFFTKASDMGYIKKDESPLAYVLKYPAEGQFGSKTSYTGISIGRYASNISFIFPNIEVGGSEYLDSYTAEELMKYKVLFLSGFEYHDKIKAENIVKEVSQKGAKVIIDMTGTESDLSSSRPEFLNVIAQPVLVKNNYPVLEYGDKKLDTRGMPEEYKNWNTSYLENLDNISGQVELDNQYMSFLGKKINDNITFIGLNLPFYAVLTKDQSALSLLEDITGIKAGEKPYREIVKINVEKEGKTIRISAEDKETITSIAYLDAFTVKNGVLSELHNLVKLQDTKAEIKISTPYIKTGIVLSILGIIVLYAFTYLKDRRYRTKIEPAASTDI